MLDWFLSSLLLYRYLALFLIMAVSAFGFPLPASLLLVAAGAFTAQDYFDLRSVLAVAFFGCLVGDGFGYWLSYRYGQELLARIGLRRLFKSKRYLKIEKSFEFHSGKIIFLSRFLVSSVGPVVNILSGVVRIKGRKFFGHIIPGEAIYVLLYCLGGYLLGSEWQGIVGILANLGVIIASLVLLALLLGYYQWRRVRRRRNK